MSLPPSLCPSGAAPPPGPAEAAALEDALFEAMAHLHRLPPDEALETAGLAAGALAAFLADTARLSGQADAAARALGLLEALRRDCADLLDDLRAARN